MEHAEREPSPAMISRATKLGVSNPEDYNWYQLCEMIDKAPASDDQRVLAKELDLPFDENINYRTMSLLLTEGLNFYGETVLRENPALKTGKVIVFRGITYKVIFTGFTGKGIGHRLVVKVVPFFQGPEKAKSFAACSMKSAVLADPACLQEALKNGATRR